MVVLTISNYCDCWPPRKKLFDLAEKKGKTEWRKKRTKAKLGRRAVLLLAQLLEANQGVPGSRHKSMCASISFYAEAMSVRRVGSLRAAIQNQIGDNCMDVINFTTLWGGSPAEQLSQQLADNL